MPVLLPSLGGAPSRRWGGLPPGATLASICARRASGAASPNRWCCSVGATAGASAPRPVAFQRGSVLQSPCASFTNGGAIKAEGLASLALTALTTHHDHDYPTTTTPAAAAPAAEPAPALPVACAGGCAALVVLARSRLLTILAFVSR